MGFLTWLLSSARLLHMLSVGVMRVAGCIRDPRRADNRCKLLSCALHVASLSLLVGTRWVLLSALMFTITINWLFLIAVMDNEHAVAYMDRAQLGLRCTLARRPVMQSCALSEAGAYT